jgi:hypothetical protein
LPSSRRRWACLAALIPAVCWSESAIPPTINLEWSKRTYQVTAPQPFGDVQLTMSVTPDRRVVGLEIWVGDNRVEVPSEVYANLFNPGEIDIAYSDPSLTASESVEYVVVAFEIGDSYLIEYEMEIEGCEAPCFDTVRDIVQIQVNTELAITSKISSLRYLGSDGI